MANTNVVVRPAKTAWGAVLGGWVATIGASVIFAPLGGPRHHRRRPERDRTDGRDSGDHLRRRKQAAEPAAEDRREEAKDRAEGQRVTERVQVEVVHARDDVGRRADTRRREHPVVGGDAQKHEHEQDEEREERGHHPVPAGAIARHSAGHVAADDV